MCVRSRRVRSRMLQLCCRSFPFLRFFGAATLLLLFEGNPQSVEARCPQLAIRCPPRLELVKWFSPQRITPALSIRPHRNETGVTQDSQMPRHSGLVNPRPPDDVVDLPLHRAAPRPHVVASDRPESERDLYVV